MLSPSEKVTEEIKAPSLLRHRSISSVTSTIGDGEGDGR